MKEVINISYESFENLEDAKRLNIINAGFKIFAEYGYTKASVTDIVKEAKIAKGSLFYYFGSKKNFFLYLYEYSAQKTEEFIDQPGPDSKPFYMAYTDFFERLEAIQSHKMKVSIEYPHMAAFMKKAIIDNDPDIKAEIQKYNDRYTRERAMLFFQGLDCSKFKEGIQPFTIIQLLTWCSEGILNQLRMEESLNPASRSSEPDFNRAKQLYNEYVQLFRSNFYKEEYL